MKRKLLLYPLLLTVLLPQRLSADPKRSTAPRPVSAAPQSAPIDFDRDVRPILAENCYKCHGFDEKQRQANLRLDTRAGAYARLASGRAAIAPGSPHASVALERMLATGAAHMPPASTGKNVTAAQIALIRRWIAQGGRYSEHWAFVPPKRPTLPAVKSAAWAHNPIDRFILARQEQAGLLPSPEADRATLLRRVTFDLTGLPAKPAELSAFLADKSPNAYERVVERLLASPRYGERMALAWLDLARYADTHGYHIDSHRDMWRWRDWVINAFNANMPYDRFTVEQLAGDLLPNATLDQRIATGFNRNHPINFEGGAIPEEYQAAYIFDRIDTTATTWMGLTMRCGQCHNHKYDPITQKDYYRFYAFFNSVNENGLDGQRGNAVPFLRAPSPEQQRLLDEATRRIADAERAMRERETTASAEMTAWEARMRSHAGAATVSDRDLLANYTFDQSSGAEVAEAANRLPVAHVRGKAVFAPGRFGNALQLDGATYAEIGDAAAFERNDKFSYGAWVYPTDAGAMTVVSRMDDAAMFRGWDLYLGDRKAFVHLINNWDQNAIRVNTTTQLELNRWTHLFMTYDGSGKAHGIKIYVDGKLAPLEYTHDSLSGTIRTAVTARIGSRNGNAFFRGMIDDARIYRRELTGDEVSNLASSFAISQILAVAPEKRSPEQKKTLLSAFLNGEDPTYRKLTSELTEAQKQRADLDAAIPTTMVMQEQEKPRDSFMLMRGQYDKPGDKVDPGLPQFLVEAMRTEPTGAPKRPGGIRTASVAEEAQIAAAATPRLTRLDLAKWLVAPNHPLTARVAVNRYWQMLFGTGLVKTAEDFGTQGERPSHPELLDWLATEFVRTGWDVKAIMRLLVTSSTYRQSSRVTPALLERDPENRLLARGPRTRLQAEFIRDQALALSGLLVDKIGGPSVRPYHPAGLWEDIAFGGGFSAQTYVQDHGEDLYRRGMYTFWKRTVPPPSLQTFDAPEREFCIVRRGATNTPLQALVLMNDPSYIETARKFAERLMRDGGATPTQRIAYAYHLALLRAPGPQETKILTSYFSTQSAAFRKNPEAAKKLLSVGESRIDDHLSATDLAAWTAVANLILNMDEVITKN